MSSQSGSTFNLKRFEYEGGTQIRLYERELTHGSVREELENDNNVFYERKEQQKNEADKEKSFNESISRTKQSIYGIARSNKWDFFLTITFNPQLVNSADYDEVTRKTTKWLNNLKSRVAPNMKYLLVPEQHKSGCWHFHGLLADCEELTLIESGIVQNGKKVYNLGNWKYGFTTVTRVEDTRKVSSYIAKYITKEVCEVTFGKKRYWASKNCIRPEQVMTVDTVTDIDEFLAKISDDVKHIKTLTTHGNKIYYIEI